jgi:hypothetical protein
MGLLRCGFPFNVKCKTQKNKVTSKDKQRE